MSKPGSTDLYFNSVTKTNELLKDEIETLESFLK